MPFRTLFGNKHILTNTVLGCIVQTYPDLQGEAAGLLKGEKKLDIRLWKKNYKLKPEGRVC